MRLISTSTFELHEFFADIPYYAILSHRWETQEVTFQDFQQGKGPEMLGWKKIKGCCEQAVVDGWEYAWIDSCCIDKTSSAELSEAINSMFEWYRQAEVCYVYLSDVHCPLSKVNFSYLNNSMWFTRGWTLQELLAPRWLEFYNSSWQVIGTKSSLADIITQITRIDHLFNYEESSIAQKMSWVSRRETTRLEDLAYCLMGLFNVHMPPLYGEGAKSFERLQYEILKQSDDESILAWEEDELGDMGLLALSPKSFRHSRYINQFTFDKQRPPFTMTSKGLRLELYLTRFQYTIKAENTHMFLATLNCKYEGRFVGLQLTHPQNINPRNGSDGESYGWLRNNYLHTSDVKYENNLRGKRAIIFTSTIPTKITYRNPQHVHVYLSSKLRCPNSTKRRLGTYGWRMETPNCYATVGILDPAVMYFKTNAMDELNDFALVVGKNPFGVQLVATTQPDGLRIQDWPNREDVEQMTKMIHGEMISVKVKKQRVNEIYSYVVNVDVVEKKDNVEPQSMETRLL